MAQIFYDTQDFVSGLILNLHSSYNVHSMISRPSSGSRDFSHKKTKLWWGSPFVLKHAIALVQPLAKLFFDESHGNKGVGKRWNHNMNPLNLDFF